MLSSQVNSRQAEVEKPCKWLQAEVDNLINYLKKNKVEIATDWRQRVYSSLVDHFDRTVHEYICQAIEIIPEAKKQEPKLSEDYYYGEVLRKIEQHAHLLLSVKSGDLLAKQDPLSRLDAIQAILSHISMRLPNSSPILIPVLTDKFMYFHLNYVNGVGIIGVPPSVLVQPYPDLPLLWHEVGGYWVAQQKIRGALKKDAASLRERLCSVQYGEKSLWNYYRDEYTRALSQNVRVKLNITERSIGISRHNTIHNYFTHNGSGHQKLNVDNDNSWQMRWFGQILADLFGLQDLGETMLSSLRFALIKSYETMDLGDYSHPWPNLRLQIATEYLKGNPVSVQGAIDQDPDKTKEIAKITVAHLLEKYSRLVKGQSDSDVVQLVKQLVDNSLLFSPAHYKPEDVTAASTIQTAFNEFCDWSKNINVEESHEIWNRPESEEYKTRLAYLLSINFVETDGIGGAPTGPLPTFPPVELITGK